ncbi:MAG: hypothetical protein M1834_001556 [Cirrosporium novae-zelandiae]|nr:MAG: hypothetical protein M1834_001556 [Cirrosporium novae-zelandiae]
MLSQKVYDLCQTQTSLSSEYAKSPSEAPEKIIKKLYGDEELHDGEKKFEEQPNDDKELQKAFECGKWGSTRPSDLFLQIYHDALCTLEKDPMVGMTSPSLMGSSGVLPLTIIAPLPDICRHMSNCIARAEKEVFLATNYWIFSDASTLITNSFRELSRRAGERGEKVVVKMIYDRGNPKQVFNNHQPVDVQGYTSEKIKIPSPEEIPNIDMQVVNYHKPPLGTFHSKYMVVDRKIGIISSNNIQDNDNMEMMTHVEGPIVDSLYDVCLASWFHEFKPPLPFHNTPATLGGFPSFEQKSFAEMFDQNGKLRDLWSDAGQDQSILANGPEIGYQGQDVTTSDESRTLQQVAEDGHQEFLPEHTSKDPHYDHDIKGEVSRMQCSLYPKSGETRMQAVTRHLNTTIQPDTKGTAPESTQDDEMAPYIPHLMHEPFPMAMVCRKPWGIPNHSCVHTPQNAAFLSALRNARKSVFIQTPDLNAEPLIPAILSAVRRGVNVTYYVCLGYNDAGELLPFQGGTNEMIANKLYTSLTASEKKNLNIFNYVAKDQVRPIHNKFKQRSCHVKLMIVDEHIGIQGNGNQDTQSWYHSQEINIMIDSPTVVRGWLEGIRRNQNTHLYGAVSKEDGCWYDEQGKMAEGAIGIDPGRLSWIKGFVGAIQRVRGVGGF